MMEQVLFYSLTNKIGDWIIRIDSRHGNQPKGQRHVHISKRGLSGEYSWNFDGSRHDEHRFPVSEKCINAAKKHAAEALGISMESLSFMVGIPGGSSISLRRKYHQGFSNMHLFNSYISVRLSVIFFGASTGLALVLIEDRSC